MPTDFQPRLGRLRSFVGAFSKLLDQHPSEHIILNQGRDLLADLVLHDDWLPPACAVSNAREYQQYLLHCDSGMRFSVVSFVWGPGQATPIHDHGIWGLVGMLRGAEISQRYIRSATAPMVMGSCTRLEPGDVETLSPSAGDVHQVSNAFVDQTSISIHVYGADIGSVRRNIFAADGSARTFISGYANETLPNIWGCLDRAD